MLIESVSGPAQRAGLQPGDLLLSIDGAPVDSIAGVTEAIGESDTSAVLLVQRESMKVYVALPLSEGASSDNPAAGGSFTDAAAPISRTPGFDPREP